MKDEDDEPSFIHHGRGDLDEYAEVIAEYEKFKVLNSAKRLEVMVAVNFLENAVFLQTTTAKQRSGSVEERMRKDWVNRLRVRLSKLTEAQLNNPDFNTKRE